MIQQVEATYANDALTPDAPLELPEQARVKVTVEAVEGWNPEKAREALEALQRRLASNPIYGGTKKYTREELHERE